MVKAQPKKNFTLKTALQDLKSNYLSPPHPIAFAGKNAIHRHYGGVLSRATIDDFLETVETYTLHKETHATKVYNPTYVRKPRSQIQLDLCSLFNQEKYNRGVRFLMVAIDVFTKKVWVTPLKTKSAHDVLSAFKTMHQRDIGPFKKLVVDLGKEWWNAHFQNYCKAQNIRMLAPRTQGHASTVERVIRSLKALIGKWITTHDKKSFVPALPSIVATMNARHHRMIGMSPNAAESNLNNQRIIRERNETRWNAIPRKKPKLREGQLVRISRLRGKFARDYFKKNTDELFTILLINDRMRRPLYTLRNLTGTEVINGQFYENELTAVKLSRNLHIANVLDSKSGKVLVNFRGLPPSFQAWIDNSNIYVDNNEIKDG
ncbi:MAG TPA: hypothetical protein EYG35_01300 [Gammaproteobacteria bacterium]|nr:hypothetical protein [Gammaproteobacteria bacterium]